MRNKNYLNSLFIIALFSMIMVIDSCTKSKYEHKIGAILPLTGEAAQYGQWDKNAIEIALEEINEAGPNKITVIYEDDQANSRLAVSAIQKLINIDKINVIIGAMTSGCTMAIAPIAEENRVILFSPAASTPALTSAGDYIFRNWPSDNFSGVFMANYLWNDEKVRKVGVIYVNNDYGVGVLSAFKSNFERLGGALIFSEAYPLNATDFRTQLSKISGKEVDAIFILGYANELGYLLKQAYELGIKKSFFGAEGIESPIMLQAAGKAANGVKYIVPYFDSETKEKPVASFVKKYNEKYGMNPELFAATAYDAMKIIGSAVQKVGTDPEKIKEHLYKLKDYQGVTGKTSFDKNGDVQKSYFVKIVREGRFEVFKK